MTNMLDANYKLVESLTNCTVSKLLECVILNTNELRNLGDLCELSKMMTKTLNEMELR